MKYTIDQVQDMVASNENLKSYNTESQLISALPEFSDDYEGNLDAAWFCTHLADLLLLLTYEEGHIARDLALKYIACAVTHCSKDDLSDLAEVSKTVLSLKTGTLYYA